MSAKKAKKKKRFRRTRSRSVYVQGVVRFVIRPGTKCAIRQVADTEWREYATTRECRFERYERYEKTEIGGFYEFRDMGWLMLVHRRNVVHLEDR